MNLKKKLTLLVSALGICLFAFAQQQLPVDPDVRYGKLENGLTYYIRYNKYPEKRADFYLAQKVGSMQEDDSQAGLAHFLEHMAFNGTTNYPGRKTMLNYLETVGARFGANVNAYTGYDETVYTLSDIPVVRQSIIDSTLQILYDWSGSLELANDEIDKERAIIKEEWRTRSGASSRTWEKLFPVIFKDSKYADRLPIGKMDVVDNFEHQVLKDYYKKWYRPDLQAVIIVGDIDADKMEAQVKEMFSKIPLPEERAERIYYSVPDNEEPIIAVLTDKENTRSLISYYIKHDKMPEEMERTVEGYNSKLATSLVTTMLSERLNEISKEASSPFVGSSVFDGEFIVSKTKDALTVVMMSKEGKEKESLATLVREIERAKRFGFTEAELERVKANYLSSFEQAYNNRNQQQNNVYVEEYVRSFTGGEPIPGIDVEYELVKNILPLLTSDAINALAGKLFTEENNVITLTSPEKEGLVLPTDNQILEIIQKVRAENIESYVEDVITEPLLAKIPKAGSIIKIEQDPLIKGMEVWTLSNGIKVAVMNTPYKDDQVIMSALAYGGYSLAKDSEINEASLINYVPYIGGIGNFNSTELKKVLAGKSVSLIPSVGVANYNFSGYSSNKDLETFMQLLYLYFTAPRKDEGMFLNIQSMILSQVRNSQNQPGYKLNEYLTFAKYGYNPRYVPLTEENVLDLNYDLIVDFYKKMIANPGSFKFSFVGSIDKKVLKPLVETYLASLPSGNKDIAYNANVIKEVRDGKSHTVFEQTMIEPKTTFNALYKAKFDYNQKNKLILSMLSQVLDIVYTRTIREEEGGTYGVGQNISLDRIPQGQGILAIAFDTDVEKVEKLAPKIHSEFAKLVSEGIKDEDFNKVKEHTLKSLSENYTNNEYWMSVVMLKLFYDEDNQTKALDLVKSITKDDLQKAVNEFLEQGNLIEVIMNPMN